MSPTTLMIAAGLVLGGIIHIVMVLIIPPLAPNDTWERLARYGEEGRFVQIRNVARSDRLDLDLDPEMSIGLCRFDLSSGFAYLQTEPKAPFWSIAVFNGWGSQLYSFNDRDAGSRNISMIIATAAQVRALRKKPPVELPSNVIVLTAEEPRGFITLRLFAGTQAARQDAQVSLSETNCSTIAIELSSGDL